MLSVCHKFQTANNLFICRGGSHLVDGYYSAVLVSTWTSCQTQEDTTRTRSVLPPHGYRYTGVVQLASTRRWHVGGCPRMFGFDPTRRPCDGPNKDAQCKSTLRTTNFDKIVVSLLGLPFNLFEHKTEFPIHCLAKQESKPWSLTNLVVTRSLCFGGSLLWL